MFKSGSQNDRLLTALKKGPMLNADIRDRLRILNYTGRISEIRQAGYDVKCQELDNGLCRYWLREPVDAAAIERISA